MWIAASADCVPSPCRMQQTPTRQCRDSPLKCKFTHAPEADTMTEPATLRDASCADDYDPNSMPVDKARALIARFLTPLTATERVHVRSALGRVLAQDVI